MSTRTLVGTPDPDEPLEQEDDPLTFFDVQEKPEGSLVDLVEADVVELADGEDQHHLKYSQGRSRADIEVESRWVWEKRVYERKDFYDIAEDYRRTFPHRTALSESAIRYRYQKEEARLGQVAAEVYIQRGMDTLEHSNARASKNHQWRLRLIEMAMQRHDLLFEIEMQRLVKIKNGEDISMYPKEIFDKVNNSQQALDKMLENNRKEEESLQKVMGWMKQHVELSGSVTHHGDPGAVRVSQNMDRINNMLEAAAARLAAREQGEIES